MIAAMVFNMVNGELLGSWFADWNRYPLSWLISPYFIIGIGLFLTGMAINMSADYKLISLRGKGETGYKLPVNGLFPIFLEKSSNGVDLHCLPGACLPWLFLSGPAPTCCREQYQITVGITANFPVILLNAGSWYLLYGRFIPFSIFIVPVFIFQGGKAGDFSEYLTKCLHIRIAYFIHDFIRGFSACFKCLLR